MNVTQQFLIFFLLTVFQWVSCTVHEIHKPLFPIKISLKIGFTVLFIHLKFILLQCFQFSMVLKWTLKRRKEASSHSIIEFIFIFFGITLIIAGWFLRSTLENSAKSPVRSHGTDLWTASSILQLSRSYSSYK